MAMMFQIIDCDLTKGSDKTSRRLIKGDGMDWLNRGGVHVFGGGAERVLKRREREDRIGEFKRRDLRLGDELVL